MRRLFTADEAMQHGMTRAALRWGVRTQRWCHVDRGVYIVGADDPSPLERAAGAVLASGGIASGALAGVLLDLDSAVLRGPDITLPPTSSGRRPGVRRRALASGRVTTVQGIRCTTGLQTLLDLAAVLDDLEWEQAMESALRKRLTTVADLQSALEVMALARTPGAGRVRRVLAIRPAGAPPTESLLETLMVQLAREVPELGEPERQVVIHNGYGEFVGRVDLAWPRLGLFVELDGEHHRGQPVYDASRETAVVAATGWLCGRFTWTEVVRHRAHTSRRAAQLAQQARRRPLPA
jgi:hypothetical protein